MNPFQYISDVGAPEAILLVFVLLMAAARPDRDPDGDGLYAVYLSGACLAALYSLLIFGAGLIEAVAEVFARDSDRSTLGASLNFDFPTGDSNHAAIGAVSVALVLAAIVYGFHTQRRRELHSSGSDATSASSRVGRAYLASVCFAMVVVILRSGLMAGNAVVEFLDPTDDHSKDLAAGTLIGYGLAALVAFLIFRTHFYAIRGRSPDPTGAATDAGDH